MSLSNFQSLPGYLQIGVLILVVIIAGGLLRFLLRLAWHIVSLMLTAAILVGVVLFLLGYLHIH